MTARRATLLLAIAHVLAYPMIAWLVWVWLGMSEASAGELAGSLVLGVFIIAACAALLASAFHGSAPPAQFLARGLLFVVITLALLALAWWLLTYTPRAGDWLAVRLSNARGRAANPRRMDWVYASLIWTTFGVGVALFLAPLLLLSRRILRDWRYWVLAAGLALVGGYLPWKLVTWVPAVKSFGAQTSSMIVRFVLAYLIAVASLLGFAASTRRLAQRDHVPAAPPAAVPTEPTRAE